MTEHDPNKLIDALFKKLDRIETKVDAAHSHNHENYRMLSVLEQRTVGNEARIKKLELENEATEAHHLICAQHRAQCPGPEFSAIKRMIWGAIVSAVISASAAAFAIIKTGGK